MSDFWLKPYNLSMSKPELMSLIPSPWGYIVTKAQENHIRLEETSKWLTMLIALWASVLFVDFTFSPRIIKESHLNLFTKLKNSWFCDRWWSTQWIGMDSQGPELKQLWWRARLCVTRLMWALVWICVGTGTLSSASLHTRALHRAWHTGSSSWGLSMRAEHSYHQVHFCGSE